MIDKRKIESLLRKWKTKLATREQKEIIRDLERLLETQEPEEETYTAKVEL